MKIKKTSEKEKVTFRVSKKIRDYIRKQKSDTQSENQWFNKHMEKEMNGNGCAVCAVERFKTSSNDYSSQNNLNILKQQGQWCDICGQYHPGQCKK